MAEKTRILVVEDESLVAEDLREMLVGFGYEVTGIAQSGEMAVKLAGEHSPDLVVMDINLSGPMDGITAGGEIRSRWKIPIIYATAFVSPSILERAKKTSPSGFIFKPYHEPCVQTSVEIALYFKRIEEMCREREGSVNTSPGIPEGGGRGAGRPQKNPSPGCGMKKEEPEVIR
jgi:CheY-like chemotaxis protein